MDDWHLADRFEMVMHVSRKGANNSGLNDGVMVLQFYPDEGENIYYRVGMLGAKTIPGNGDKQVCLEASTGTESGGKSKDFIAPFEMQPADIAYPSTDSAFKGAGLYLRVQGIGTTLRLKYWPATEPEPTAWTKSTEWAPPPFVHHWNLYFYALRSSDNTVDGVALGSFMLRELPASGWDQLLGSDYPPTKEVGALP